MLKIKTCKNLLESSAINHLLFYVGHLVIHIICLISVLDIYFSSTIVQEVVPLQWATEPDAQRIVLFVADGLRADKFYELDQDNKTKTPFLRNIIFNKGTWGVSHTKAPTESRPAHIAMLGGFYEDPSALWALWKHNVVEFDTVLNESRESWCYGGNDVVNFFNKGTAENHVHVVSHSYRVAHLSDLDRWVLTKVQDLFKEAKKDSDLQRRLQNDKIIFFLHLAGIDSNGHAFHPGSKIYAENIMLVDNIVKSTVELFDKFYESDGKTAYLFTGDHGMTDPGGHGGNHPTETKTPFIVWGAGISTSNKNIRLTKSETTETIKWGLEPKERCDVQQIDVSVLMASIIGVPFPVNSVGKIPMPYLPDGHSKAEKSLGRAKQLVRTFLTKKDHLKQKEFHLLFVPYRFNELQQIKHWETDIVKDIQKNDYELAITESKKLTEFAIGALDYYQNYSKLGLRNCIIFAIFGWIFLTLLKYLHSCDVIRHTGWTKSPKFYWFSILLTITMLLRLYQLDLPMTNYFYVAAPTCIWLIICSYILKSGCENIGYAIASIYKNYTYLLLSAVTFILLIAAGFYYRKLFSALTMACSILPYLNNNASRKMKFVWSILCVCVSIFPLLPEIVKQRTDKKWIILAGILGVINCMALSIYHKKCNDNFSKVNSRFGKSYTFITSILPGVVTVSIATSFWNAVIGKGILFFGWIIPLLCKANSFHRLTVVNSLHIAAYLLLSVSYDALFFVMFNALLHIWVLLESKTGDYTENLHSPSQNRTESQTHIKDIHGDVRRVCTVILFFALAFFGLYSIQSMNHFTSRSLPFLPATNTFNILLLFIYKLHLHFVAVAVALCTLLVKTKSSLASNWFLTAAFCDALFSIFFLLVKTEGSWAEIGLSLANVCIFVGLPIVLSVLLIIGKAYVSIQFCRNLT